MLYLVLMHFIVDFAQKWLREKTFYKRLFHFIVDFERARFENLQQLFQICSNYFKFAATLFYLQQLYFIK